MSYAVTKLKNYKAAGHDGVVAEYLKFADMMMIRSLHQLIELVWVSEQVPDDWRLGVVRPIPKPGRPVSLENLRPITLLTVLYKVFSIVLHHRLQGWCVLNNIILPEQAGFLPNHSCQDQVFTLLYLVRERQGKPLYCCFVDITKAYDSIWREGLWSCLWAEGVRGKMLRILRLLYLHTPNFLRFGRHKSVIFELRKGVKEGCILSPLLSDIFFNNLVREIKALGLGHMSEALYILVALLLFADDIVVIADSPHELQQLLTALSQYAARWRFELSSSKTKVLVFNNRLSVSQSEYRYFLGDHQIEVVSEFRYLGIILHYSLSWSSMKTHLLHAATAANHRVVSIGHIRRYFTVRFIRQLFSACIRSHFEYGVAVWSPVGKLQKKFSEISSKLFYIFPIATTPRP